MKNMAEQEFLSHWLGRNGRWYALPPEFNFQLHQVFLSSAWWPPRGQTRPSKYYQMLRDTPIIKIWHFSGEKEPFDFLYELVPGASNEDLDWRVGMFAHDCMMDSWNRMDPAFQDDHEHIDLILSVHKQATEEWLSCWEGTWKTIFTGALSEIHPHAFTQTSDSQKIRCNACGHTWDDPNDFDYQARDYVLANCPEALTDIEMQVTKCPNLMLLPFKPVGKQVEGHLTYLGKVIQSWKRYNLQDSSEEPSNLPMRMPDPMCDTFVKANIPMYTTTHGLLMVPEPPIPAEEEEEAASTDPVKEKRKFLRRLATALDTLRRNFGKKSNDEVADDEVVLQTLENAVPAKKSYMHYRDCCLGEHSER